MATWRTQTDVAIHESGHAGLAIVEGVEIDRVEIADRAGMTFLKGIFRPAVEGRIYWGGALAEARFRQGSPYAHPLNWHRDAEGLLVARGDGELIQAAIKAAWPESRGEDFGRRSYELCRAAMAQLGRPRVWAAVLAIAGELEARGRLDGAEVERLFRGGVAHEIFPTAYHP